jgi:hypothetical protein
MVRQIRFVDFFVGSKSSPSSLPMSRHQPSHTHKTDRSRYIAAKISDLRNFYYCMSVFELDQCSLVFCALAHNLNDDQGTCDK